MRLRAALATAAVATALAPAAASAQTPNPFEGLPENPLSSLITTVPYNTYAPDTIPVVKSLGLEYVNLDIARHDVVALEATRPDGSAGWCEDYEDPDDPEAQTCPLFWTPLIPGGGTQEPVQGLEDTVAGESYRFYCTIHPYMLGTIEVVG
jgi:plastocyanin